MRYWNGGQAGVVVFIDESQDKRYFLLAAVTIPSTDVASAILAQSRKALGSASRSISEFHESALNRVTPNVIDALLDNMAFEYSHHGKHRMARRDVGVWTAYYRKTRAERSTQSLPFPLLLAAYTRLFSTLLSEIQPEMGTHILCDGFQGMNRILPELQDIADDYRATVTKGESSLAGVQLADVAAGTTRRFLSQQNLVRYGRMKDIVRLHKEVFLSAK